MCQPPRIRHSGGQLIAEQSGKRGPVLGDEPHEFDISVQEVRRDAQGFRSSVPSGRGSEYICEAEDQECRERGPAPLVMIEPGGLDQGCQALNRASGGVLVMPDPPGPRGCREQFHITVPLDIELFEQCRCR